MDKDTKTLLFIGIGLLIAVILLQTVFAPAGAGSTAASAASSGMIGGC